MYPDRQEGKSTINEDGAIAAIAHPPASKPFELSCAWANQPGHPHLSIGYVVLDDETLWGVYACSATNVTSGNEWSFTLPMSLSIHEVTALALNVIAWDRFVVIEEERFHYDENAKHAIAASLRLIERLSRPGALVTAIRTFLDR